MGERLSPSLFFEGNGLWPRRRAHFQNAVSGLGAVPISRKNELWPRRRAHSESQEFGAKLRIICLVVCGLGAVPIFPKTELWPRRRACSLSWAAHAFFMRLALLMPASVGELLTKETHETNVLTNIITRNITQLI